MNRTIKQATGKRYHYEVHDQLRRHLADFLDAYNFGRRLNHVLALMFAVKRGGAVERPFGETAVGEERP